MVRVIQQFAQVQHQLTLETVKVLTTITRLAAMTARSAVMFIARITFRMMKPGPARVLLLRGIFSECRFLRKLTAEEAIRETLAN